MQKHVRVHDNIHSLDDLPASVIVANFKRWVTSVFSIRKKGGPVVGPRGAHSGLYEGMNYADLQINQIPDFMVLTTSTPESSLTFGKNSATGCPRKRYEVNTAYNYLCPLPMEDPVVFNNYDQADKSPHN